MGWFGTGKPRTKFGRWLDKEGLTQQEASEETGVSQDTITRLASDKAHQPTMRTRRRLERGLKNRGFRSSDFWEPPM